MDYVISANLRRRHLSETQRSIAMANLCNLARGSNQHKQVVVDAVVTVPDADDFVLAVSEKVDGQICPSITTAQAAEKAGVSEKTMKHAIAVNKKGSPELIAAVTRDEISVSAAAQVVKALPRQTR